MKSSDNTLMANYKKIACNIKALRKIHHMTQAQMAERLEMDTQYYAVLERADTPNRTFTLDKVLIACYVFNCTPNDIIGTDFESNTKNIQLLKARLNAYVDKMSEHQLKVLVKYAEDIIPMI